MAERFLGALPEKNSLEPNVLKLGDDRCFALSRTTTSEHDDVLLIKQGPLGKCVIVPPPEYHFPIGIGFGVEAVGELSTVECDDGFGDSRHSTQRSE